MTSVSIVREKERGTMEVLHASQLKLGTMIFAKTIPYMVISFIDFIKNMPRVDIVTQYKYSSDLDYKNFMIPGFMVLLLTFQTIYLHLQ